MLRADDVLAPYRDSTPVSPDDVARDYLASGRVLVVLDDDPTGTQSVADLPVLTRWEVADFRWAFDLRIDDHPASAPSTFSPTLAASTPQRLRSAIAKW